MELAVLKGFQSKNTVTVSNLPYVIGRCRSANLIIAHVNVSRNHCNIIKENNLWKINDYSSSGTFVNDVLVGKGNSVVLKDGDTVRFGPAESNLTWTFHSLESPQKANKETTTTSEVLNDQPCNENINSNSNDKKLVETRLADRGNEEKLKDIQSSLNIEPQVQGANKDLKESSNTLEKDKCVNGLLGEQPVQCSSKSEQLDEPNKSDTSKLLENLVDLMETELQCTICSELFVTAVMLSCTHMFCKFCIDQWKKKQKTCPICRKKISAETRSLVVDNYIDKMVGNLSVELKERREAIIEERKEKIKEPVKKKAKVKK